MLEQRPVLLDPRRREGQRDRVGRLDRAFAQARDHRPDRSGAHDRVHGERLPAMLDRAEILETRVVRIALARERAMRDERERVRIEHDALGVRDGREPEVDLAPGDEHDALARERRARVVEAAVAARQVAARDEAAQLDRGFHRDSSGRPSNQRARGKRPTVAGQVARRERGQPVVVPVRAGRARAEHDVEHHRRAVVAALDHAPRHAELAQPRHVVAAIELGVLAPERPSDPMALLALDRLHRAVVQDGLAGVHEPQSELPVLAADRVAQFVEAVERHEELARRADAGAEELAALDRDRSLVVAQGPATVDAARLDARVDEPARFHAHRPGLAVGAGHDVARRGGALHALPPAGQRHRAVVDEDDVGRAAGDESGVARARRGEPVLPRAPVRALPRRRLRGDVAPAEAAAHRRAERPRARGRAQRIDDDQLDVVAVAELRGQSVGEPVEGRVLAAGDVDDPDRRGHRRKTFHAT